MDNPRDNQQFKDRQDAIEWVKQQYLLIDPAISHSELRIRIHQLVPLKTWEKMLIFNPYIRCAGSVIEKEPN